MEDMGYKIQYKGTAVVEGTIIEDFRGEQWRFVRLSREPSREQGQSAKVIVFSDGATREFYAEVFPELELVDESVTADIDADTTWDRFIPPVTIPDADSAWLIHQALTHYAEKLDADYMGAIALGDGARVSALDDNRTAVGMLLQLVQREYETAESDAIRADRSE
jgi:hypothetical protein